MKQTLLFSLALLIILFSLPLLALKDTPLADMADKPAETTPPPVTVTEAVTTTATAPPLVLKMDETTMVRVNHGGQTIEMTMADYLQGVVAAEMDYDYPLEALKATAVAARSYALYKQALYAEKGFPEAHPDADVCGNSGHCKAYFDIETRRARFGDDFTRGEELIRRAVSETDGMVAAYENRPILAVFHAISSGHTEDAAEVWGGDYPYLISVVSEGDETAPQYETQVTFSAGELKGILEPEVDDGDWSKPPTAWFGDVTYTSGGGVERWTVLGTPIAGTKLRGLLGLRSTHFKVSASQDSVTFTVQGYGHGVGMSQFGARSMALAGADYREIIEHYYSGAVVQQMTNQNTGVVHTPAS